MRTKTTSPLGMVLRNLTDAELHDLLKMVHAELLNRPGRAHAPTVEVVTSDDVALLAFFPSLYTSQRGLLWWMACARARRCST